MSHGPTRKGPPKPHGESIPNLAPLVDVIMVLLIFFMLGAKLTVEGVLQTELDTRSGPAAGQQVQINPTIRIGLQDIDDGQSCNIYVLEEQLGESFDELKNFMDLRRSAGADTKNAVVIGAEGTVRYKYIIAAFDACVRAGFQNVQFAVSFAESDGG